MKYSEFKKEGITLLIVGDESVDETTQTILKNSISKKNQSCIYVTVRKPSKNIKNESALNKKTPGKLIFVDCVDSALSQKLLTDQGGNIFAHPDSLTAISIAITTLIERQPEKKNITIVFDNLSALSMHHDKSMILMFMYYLSAKLRSLGVRTYFIMIKDQSDKLFISQISQFVDQTGQLDSE
jgi:hypothetical protein